MNALVESKNRELKPEQREAAHTLDRHVAVTAGPGAGKTTVLVERYLHILRNYDVSVDQIVAITFTNRAANEMRERLRRELDKLLAAADAGGTLESTRSPDAGGTPALRATLRGVERAKWMRHKRTLDGAIITTIHGFCSRLLREFPVEAGIDPQFSLLDAHQSAMLEEAVSEESVTEVISSIQPAITELAAAVGRARLARGLIGIYRSMRNQGLTLRRLADDVDASHKGIEEYRRAADELNAKMGEFIRARGLTASAEEKRAAAERRWPGLRDFLVAVSESTPVAEFSGAVQEFRDATRPNAQGKIGEVVKELDRLIWENNLRGAVPQCFFDLHAKRYTKELIRVAGLIEQRLDEEKRRRSALDFDDLQVRALRLLYDHPEVLRRTASRYRFFLVDEFQDTNSLQRDLLEELVLSGANAVPRGSPAENPSALSDGETANRRLKPASRSNLFIVGDRKQSIYGFRGADVDVFREMTARIESHNGLPVALNRNFRSQPPLIRFFNFLFEHTFTRDASLNAEELNELGYVEHEASVEAREDLDAPPVVELLLDLRSNEEGEDQPQKPRERDAEQLARRIGSLVGNESISVPPSDAESSSRRPLEYRDVALLFRAMTEVHLYESALRRAGVPYVTVDGKGFYAREEITDFIQLLRFLDNKTDEVALAAVLRSPICGLSDDALLALRCAPLKTKSVEREIFQRRSIVRPLLQAVGNHETIDHIDPPDRLALDRARRLLNELIRRRKRSQVSKLVRFAVEASEYRIVAAANFDGAQRLANIEKLFTLAERFERSGAYLIRDFVRFVQDFEESGGRESEGQIDDSANAVRLLSIHQSKGLEFPVVIIPDLHRQPDNRREWWALDRRRGLTVKVPDGRGRLVGGCAFWTFADRAKRREEFESMRLLYVAATRAKDRLILSGAAKDLSSLRSSWLDWVRKALQLDKQPESGVLTPGEDISVRLVVNLTGDSPPADAREIEEDLSPPAGENLPLLQQIEPRPGGLHRFSVTQLLNYRRCPRQYYFDRVLHTPPEDQVEVWNDADAPEPPANLTATLKGAVIHRFCETYVEGEDVQTALRKSFDEVLRLREAQLSERLIEIDPAKAVRDLAPLAANYVTSKVRERIEAARAAAQHWELGVEQLSGVTSELRFRLRRPLGLVTGTVDKLLIYQSAAGLNAEIIDFKTNRFNADRQDERISEREQLAFDFASGARERPSKLQDGVDAAVRDYRLQMQSYALAVRELLPSVARVKVTLHFLDPNLEASLPDALLQREAAARAIDEAMAELVSSSGPGSFQPVPAAHCRVCNFLELCQPGRRWLSENLANPS